MLAILQKTQPGGPEAAALSVRRQAAGGDFRTACRHLDEALARHPNSLTLKLVRSQVLLQEGRDWAAAEQSLRDVLAIAPDHADTRRNLRLLLLCSGQPAPT